MRWAFRRTICGATRNGWLSMAGGLDAQKRFPVFCLSSFSRLPHFRSNLRTCYNVLSIGIKNHAFIPSAPLYIDTDLS